MEEINKQRQIPRNELERFLSEDYKDLLKLMRGQRKDNAFSNYSRFTPLTKFELEAIEERDKTNFSVVDVHDKLFKRVPNYPPFV
jgi:hypothetical protein